MSIVHDSLFTREERSVRRSRKGNYYPSHLMRGEQKFRGRKYGEALKDYEAALDYPENLEVGRPYRGGRSSQVYCFIGNAFEALGDKINARTMYEKSVTEELDWSDVRYYQGLSFQKRGQEEKAYEIFNGLIRFGEEKLRAGSGLDYFAKFGEKQSELVRRSQGHYLAGLGYLGKGERARAKAEFEETLKLNINHVWARVQIAKLS